MNMPERQQVLLFSDPNFLSLNILRDLLNNNFTVNIISDQRKEWTEKATDINNRSNILITPLNKYKKVSSFSYAIYCGGFMKKSLTINDFKKFISNKNFGVAKTLAIFPIEMYPATNTKSIVMSKDAGIIYLGDLFGPQIDLKSDLLLPSLINNMIDKRTLTLGVGELFSPILVSDASKVITRDISSLVFYGSKTFLMGKHTTSTDFWKQNVKYFPGLKIIYDTKVKTRVFPKEDQIRRLNSDLSLFLNITYRWLIKDKIPVKITLPNRPLKPKKPNKFLRPFIICIFLILIFPLITGLISSGLLFFSYKNFISNETNISNENKLQNSQRSALLAKTIFIIGEEESKILSHLPGFGKFYKETRYVSYIGENLSDMLMNGFPMANTAEDIINNILGNQIYDLKTPSMQLKSGLDYFYQKISLIQIETKENANDQVLGAKQILNLVDFDKYKNLIQQSSVLINNLPTILGSDTNRSYLTLFQNNMELRPTGGFIGSYGIADFGGGKLNGLTINDIYSADGQLKGHIDPPEPIKKYLGEANWFFRDSNWNPDFATSAQRAEWFLNKEMEQKVDGVVAVDLTPIKKILSYTGPIFLADYNLTVTADNLYEKTQQESQANFFAGSRKKASFLTALSRVLIGKIPQINSKQKLGVLKSIYSALEERSIQIHFNDQTYQDPVDKLAWNGGVSTYSCGDTCYSDFFSDVEANVGVNKSNYFISRGFDFNVSLDKNQILRTLNINLVNSANPSLGASGQYKVYLRILIPQDAHLLGARILNRESQESLPSDVVQTGGRQEVGVYVEILPGDRKTINFRWTTDVSGTKIGSYGLFVRKQAGTESDPINIQLDSKLPVILSSPVFTLTNVGSYTYNTTLSKDFFSRVSFK